MPTVFSWSAIRVTYYTLVYRMVDHKETAEDLTQEVFVKLFRSLSHFRGDAKLTTWLYRMTRISLPTSDALRNVGPMKHSWIR